MGYESEYKRILNKLFAARVRDLVSLIGKNKPGKPLEITKDKLDEYIEKLKELVESAIGKELLNEELDTAKDHHKWLIKGRGVEARIEEFNNWYKDNFGNDSNCVYMYWAEGDKCIYVGRGTSGGQRPGSHLVDVRFQSSKWLEIYTFGGPTLLHKIECMATHLYDPSLNKVASSRYERDKSCPLCIRYKIIEDELNAIFR